MRRAASAISHRTLVVPLRQLLASLLRLLFPSWAFFDAAVAAPSLEVRDSTPDGAPSPWESALRPPARRWWHVLYNPAGNYILAAQGQVERLHLALLNDEAGHPDSADNDSTESDSAITRTLVQQFAEARVPDRRRGDDAAGWQWRIVARDRGRASETVRSDTLR